MKTVSFALSFAIAALLAAPAIATLDSMQVRPSAEQIAQRSVERNSGVVTLAALQVRPSADTQSVIAIGSVVSGALDSAMLQLQPSLQNLSQDLTTSLAR
ncbi:hypothetical protein [Xanthomonas cerealis]|uniref:hypothetical protein n=1 Tax=Xanthomonas cerealis TaxID=3390025 RepID=UPI0005794638|nr:hypothetical protein [Xanthomonas translucens]UKE47036.1 hypothetical protein KHA79_18675 [Xanthomonas translucens pv. cerealis]UKE69396.1 hypothetical protein K8O61_18545 [Xanthomonas translucens pv. pistacia]